MTMETKQVWVGIVMGSDSDKAIALAARETLPRWGSHMKRAFFPRIAP